MAALRIQAIARGRAVRLEAARKVDAARAKALRSGGRRRSSVMRPANAPLITPPTSSTQGLGATTSSFRREHGEAMAMGGDQIESTLSRVEEAVGLEPESMAYGINEEEGEDDVHGDAEAVRQFAGVRDDE